MLGIIVGISYLIPGLCSASLSIILGVYSDLIEILSSFYNIRTIRKHFLFIIGMTLGFILGVLVYLIIFDKIKLYLTSIFIGFIMTNIKFSKTNKKVLIKNIIIYTIVIIFLFVINDVGKIRLSYISENLNLLGLIFIFITSFISAIAFILPGISGSMLLFMFGLYDVVFKSFSRIITNIFSFQTLTGRNFIILFVFFIGFLSGILAFSKIIDKIIKKKNETFIIISNAFIVGSLLVLVYDVVLNINFIRQWIICLALVIVGCIIGLKIIKRND